MPPSNTLTGKFIRRQHDGMMESPLARSVENRHIFLGTLWGCVRHSFSRSAEFRYQFVREFWVLAKAFGAHHVRNVPLEAIAGLSELPVSGTIGGTVSNYDTFVLAALCRALAARTFFEIGTYLGHTTYAVAHNNPAIKIITLDLPRDTQKEVKLELTDSHLFERWDRGLAFADKPEKERITQLFGDSAQFDFSPYHNSMDMVFIDASHSYSYVRNDTEKALKMLTPTGTIVWHDYPAYPGVYAYLNELGKTVDNPILHIQGTGLAIYSRQQILLPAAY